MPFITFTTANAVRIKDVDDQHRRLFDLLNRLHAAVSAGEERGELRDILDELVEYTVYHFEIEEGLCREHGFPGYAEHKTAHDELAATAFDLQGKLREGGATLSFELLDFLHGWLMEHTMGLDQEMGPYLRERGVR